MTITLSAADADEIEAALRNAAIVLSEFELSCSTEREAYSALAKLRAAKAANQESEVMQHSRVQSEAPPEPDNATPRSYEAGATMSAGFLAAFNADSAPAPT